MAVRKSAAKIVGQVFNLPSMTRQVENQVENLPHALLQVRAH
jgi:hypothetical protein